MRVSEARGVVLCALAREGVAVAEYTPTQVKEAVCGYGAARKPQVARMVANLLGVPGIPGHDDVADACAVAVCHHHRARLGTLTSRTRERRESTGDSTSRSAARVHHSCASFDDRADPGGGALAQVGDDHVVVRMPGGVGYEVFCHLRTIATLHASRDTEVTLHVHTSVSADAIRLYGFVTSETSCDSSAGVIGVERIGPKAALGILGRAELPTLVRAIAEGDIALVATVPGIGRKTAERVILELRDKVGALEPPGTQHPAATSENQAVAAAIAGLVGLGFRESEARSAVAAIAVDGNGHDVADLVGAALRRLDTAGASR